MPQRKGKTTKGYRTNKTIRKVNMDRVKLNDYQALFTAFEETAESTQDFSVTKLKERKRTLVSRVSDEEYDVFEDIDLDLTGHQAIRKFLRTHT